MFFSPAAKVGGIHANNIYRAEFLYDNLMIEANVIDAAWKFGVKKLLFLGSSCIYPKNSHNLSKRNTCFRAIWSKRTNPMRSPRLPASSFAKVIVNNMARISLQQCRPTFTAPTTTTICSNPTYYPR